MLVKDYTLHGEGANRDFDLVVYGSKGQPVIAFPEADASCVCWENNGMVAALADLIEAGTIQLFCVDSLDDESWHATGALDEYRRQNLADWFDFIEHELLAFVGTTSTSRRRPLLVGAGMGAMNVTVALLRKPAAYAGLLALSGTYDVRALVGDWAVPEWLAFSPVDLVANLDPASDVVKALKDGQLAFVSGQEGSETGAWSQSLLEERMAALGIDATFELWGYDVSHDWCWWQEMCRQLLPCLLKRNGLEQRRLTARVSRAEVEAQHAEEVLAAREAELAVVEASLSQTKGEVKVTAARQEAEEHVVLEHERELKRLADLATEAWAERDRIAQLLAHANDAGNEAQAKADAAAEALSEAEWIAGEAKGAAERAAAEHAAAKERVREARTAAQAAKKAKAAADKALVDVQAELKAKKEAHTAAKPKARKASAKATKKPTAKKMAAKRSADAPAT
ncbi:alpha/beta hydrolase-fold protein [Olsenella profusa]|uniref:Putative esterase n=1 Tax=Olsenella profusa F0195 TaxID=1125712 RepID=U2TX81_9ACTN|nr:alpha/beta hydrolase-fold protein [Olsenella profusa]ERL10648.1 putative esterase [Olsenella profusa F0195]